MNWKLVTTMVLTSFLVVGCSQAYLIKLRDGQTLTTKNKPKLDRKSGYYEYKNEAGKKVRLKEDDVLLIQEQ